ncbi:MAG TPA: hypothetical protein VN798_00865, partial [Pseudomonas sp.]|nr:hypothetical protein [Pseudomonas sp.]
YIVGERGMVWKLDPQGQRFDALPTGYAGSFFGVIGDETNTVAFGLRGNAYQTQDAGNSWQVLPLPTQSAINKGVMLPGGRLGLVTQTGQVLTGALNGAGFTATMINPPDLLTGVVKTGSDTLVLTGLGGIHRATLPLAQWQSPQASEKSEVVHGQQ